MDRLQVHPDQAEATRYHAGLGRGAHRLQRPILSRERAARVVEVELLRAVMSAPPERR